jgi:hypothetical protein
MSLAVIFLFVLCATGFLLKLIVEREYPWWAPRLANGILCASALVMPRHRRSDRRKEWEAELAAICSAGGTGLAFAFAVALRVPWQVRNERRIPPAVSNIPDSELSGPSAGAPTSVTTVELDTSGGTLVAYQSLVFPDGSSLEFAHPISPGDTVTGPNGTAWRLMTTGKWTRLGPGVA